MLHDKTDHDWYGDAGDVAAQIHRAPQKTDLIPRAEQGRDAPVQAAPTQEEQCGGQQGDCENRIAGIRDREK